MSVFSCPQGRPPGVRALIGLLAAFPEGLTSKEIEAWMRPGTYQAPAEEEEGADTSRSTSTDASRSTSVSNTMGAARSLDLIQIDEADGRYRVPAAVAARAATDLASLIHDRFVQTTDTSDRFVVALYAFVVCRSQKEGGVGWLADVTNKELVDNVNAAFDAAGDEYAQMTVNTTRFAPWKDWTSFIGLGFDGIPGASVFFLPEATRRVGTELAAVGTKIGYDKPHPAGDVIRELSFRCPYLDGGSAYRALATALGLREQAQLSPILSRALRGLRAAQRIALEGGGDSSDSLTLVGDGVNKTEPFREIRIVSAQGLSA